MKIEVRPVAKQRWHGKTGKESFTRPVVLNVLVNAETRQYATGLNYVDKTFTDPDNSKNKLTEAEYYEKLLKVDLSPQFNESVMHPFWDSRTPKIKLENKTMFFDTEIPLDYIKVKIMKASKYVANSQKEYDEGFYPDATHVITDEAEELEAKASKVAIKNEVVLECSKLSRDKKIQLMLILGGKNLKGNSDNLLAIELDELINNKAKELLSHLKMDNTELALHAMVLEALQKNVLRKQGHKIMYHDSTLGNDIYEVIEYFTKDENQDLKLRIMTVINE